jgi:uncharacterized damage-inducible protein DinB
MRKDGLMDALLRSFDGGAWHGPAVLDTLEHVTPEQAAWQPPGGAHTVWEIALHIAAWSNEVAARLEGKTAGEPAEGDYPSASGEWDDAVEKVRQARTRILTVVEKLRDADLEKMIGREHNAELATGFTYAATIDGLIQHNAYHAGQMRTVLKISGALD